MKPMKLDDQAEQSLRKAEELRRLGMSNLTDKSSNTILRDALREYLTAYWIFKDKREEIFETMCEIGKFIHNRFGCPIKFNGNSYIMNCPVRLSQISRGFSIGGAADYICSICGKDPIECNHIRGKKYNDVLCQEINGICNICLSEKSLCEHDLGKHYDHIDAVRIVTNLMPDHIAFVSEPCNPLCRIFAFTLDIKSIVGNLPQELGDQFEYGKSMVFCDYCVTCLKGN